MAVRQPPTPGRLEPALLADTLQAASCGDAPAWTLLVNTYSPRVFALLLKQCRDRDLAEELTQSAFVKIVQKIGTYDHRGKFEPWLFRVAMNGLRDEMRRRARQARPMAMTGSDDAAESGQGAWAAAHDHIAADSPFGGSRTQAQGQLGEDPRAVVARAEQVQQLRAAIAELSPADQEVLHLRHTAGLSFPEIAEALEQPLGTVLARGHRALKKLRVVMTEKQGESP